MFSRNISISCQNNTLKSTFARVLTRAVNLLSHLDLSQVWLLRILQSAASKFDFADVSRFEASLILFVTSVCQDAKKGVQQRTVPWGNNFRTFRLPSEFRGFEEGDEGRAETRQSSQDQLALLITIRHQRNFWRAEVSHQLFDRKALWSDAQHFDLAKWWNDNCDTTQPQS